jgi:hypothetical protein
VFNREILIREALECAKFYFTAYGVRRLCVTLPRSGHNYTLRIINSAWDIAQGGTGEYYYDEEKAVWKPAYLQAAFDWRTPVKKVRTDSLKLERPIIFHSHLPYHHIENFQKKNMRIVVLVRNIFDQLESLFVLHKGHNTLEQKQDEFISEGYVDMSIGFYNSWGKFLERHNSLLVKYEKLIQNPCETVKSISDFCGLNLPESSIQAAVAKCSREKMLKRIPQNQLQKNPRVSIKSHNGIFSDAAVEFIRSRIEKCLRYNLGYDYSRGRDTTKIA